MINSDEVLLVSAPAERGERGGVFVIDGHEVVEVDRLPTSGLALSPDRSSVARVTWSDESYLKPELMLYDDRGLVAFRRLDEVVEPHGIMWNNDGIFVVSTGSNRVMRFSDQGIPIELLAPGLVESDGDRWHLNSLTAVGDRTLVSCFGKFADLRGWSSRGALERAGLVLDLHSGATVVAGLSAPHDPAWLGASWLVCNSHRESLAEFDPTGRQVRSLALGGWTRGLEVIDSLAYVGVSAHRLSSSSGTAEIAVVDLESFSCVDRIKLEVKEVFALLSVPSQLAIGLQLGTTVTATSHFLNENLLQQVDIDPNLMRAELELLSSESRDSELMLNVQVSNKGSVPLSPYGRFPIRLGARSSTANSSHLDLARSSLSKPLMPGESENLLIRISYDSLLGGTLTLSLLQEEKYWFDDVQGCHGIEVRFPEH